MWGEGFNETKGGGKALWLDRGKEYKKNRKRWVEVGGGSVRCAVLLDKCQAYRKVGRQRWMVQTLTADDYAILNCMVMNEMTVTK